MVLNYPEYRRMVTEYQDLDLSEQLKRTSQQMLEAAPNNVYGLVLLEMHKKAVALEALLEKLAPKKEEASTPVDAKKEEKIEVPKEPKKEEKPESKPEKK